MEDRKYTEMATDLAAKGVSTEDIITRVNNAKELAETLNESKFYRAVLHHRRNSRFN